MAYVGGVVEMFVTEPLLLERNKLLDKLQWPASPGHTRDRIKLTADRVSEPVRDLSIGL